MIHICDLRAAPGLKLIPCGTSAKKRTPPPTHPAPADMGWFPPLKVDGLREVEAEEVGGEATPL